jgi:hypothetical protein
MPTEADMLLAGANQTTRIRQRTQEGIDVNGVPFAPYSPGYAKTRAKAGRNTTPVDLLFSGRMLTSMVPQVTGPNTFAISVMDQDAQTYGPALNDGKGRMPERKFFSTSQQELNAMAADLGGAIAIRTK